MITVLRDSLSQPFAGDAFDWLLASGINVEDDERVGVAKCRREFMHEVAGTGVAVGLEDDVNLAISALASGGKRGADFGRVMAVVVDDGDASCLPAELKAAIHAAKSFERFANAGDGNVESDANGDGSGRVQDVVQTRDVEMEFAEIFAAKLYGEGVGESACLSG